MVVTALPDLPEPTVDLVFPEPTVIPVLRDVTANQAQTELLVEMALPEQQVLMARPALKRPKAIRVEPETAERFAHIYLSKTEFALGDRCRMKQGETQMKPSTKDQINGTVRELKGEAKQKVGQVTKNPTLAAKGQSEKLAGKIQKKVGQIENVLEK